MLARTHPLSVLLNIKRNANTYKKHFQKGRGMQLQKPDVGRAMCRQGRFYKDCTSDPISTPYFTSNLLVQSTEGYWISCTKDVGMGLLV